MMKRALRRSVWISIIAALTLSQQAFAYDVVTNVITTSTSSSSGSTSGPTTTNSVRGSFGPGYTAQTGYQATTTGGTYYQTPYTTTYTGAPTAYTLNGVTYNTVLTGPGTGLISGNTTAGLTPGVMNPAGFKYSTSSSVVNARYVIVNTYAHTGWQFDAAGMWYLNENGTYPVSCWQQIDGSFIISTPMAISRSRPSSMSQTATGIMSARMVRWHAAGHRSARTISISCRTMVSSSARASSSSMENITTSCRTAAAP